MKKLIALIVIICVLVSCFCILAGADETANEPEILDEKTFKDLWYQFFSASCDLYDLNDSQYTYPTVILGYDSNGVPYANGKCYYYINYGDRDLSGCYSSALENFKKCLTPELAERMVENFHVPGGPDVELIRRGSDGNWYRLCLIRPFPSVNNFIIVESNEKKACVRLTTKLEVLDQNYRDRGFDAPVEIYNDIDCTVELVYTSDGWRVSGGDIFDYIRDYAATSPYTSDKNGTRAAILAATAAVAAVVPAVIFTVSRRRKITG